MGWITTGTVNLTQGSNVVTGVGSKFLEDGRIGDGFRGPNGAIYEVINIATNTALTIQPVYEGASVNGAAYYLVPIEGYVKDSADQLRAATKQIALIPNSKQDKAVSLTALAGVAGVRNAVPYFTTADTMALKSLSSGTREPMGANIALVGQAGWGAETPLLMPSGTDANNLRGNVIVQFDTGGVNLPVYTGVTSEYWFVRNFENGAGYCAQEATSFMVPNATFRRQRNPSTGWTPWLKSVEPGNFGLGGDNLYKGNLDTLVNFAPIGLSQWRCDQTTTGSLPPGFVNNAPFDGCTVVVSKYNNDWCRLWLTGGTGGQGGGFIGGTYTRLMAGAVQGPWLLEYNIQNTLNPVDNANGRTGLMDNSVIGEWRVSRFANGLQVASSSPANISLAANEIKATPFTTPVPFPDWGKTSVTVTASPGSSVDWYGVTATTVNSPTAGYFHLRNGPVAQVAQTVRITITGFWK